MRASFLLCVLAFLQVGFVHADPVFHTYVSGYAYVYYSVFNCQDSGTTHAECVNGDATHGPYATFSSATASDTQLIAESDVENLSNNFDESYAHVHAEASTTENWAVLGGAGSGFIQYLFTVEGSFYFDDAASMSFTISQNGRSDGTGFSLPDTCTYLGPLEYSCLFASSLYPIEFGKAFAVDFSARADNGARLGYGLRSEHIEADYIQAQVFDSNLNAVRGFEIVNAPEPATIFLVPAAGLALFSLRRTARLLGR